MLHYVQSSQARLYLSDPSLHDTQYPQFNFYLHSISMFIICGTHIHTLLLFCVLHCNPHIYMRHAIPHISFVVRTSWFNLCLQYPTLILWYALPSLYSEIRTLGSDWPCENKLTLIMSHQLGLRQVTLS